MSYSKGADREREGLAPALALQTETQNVTVRHIQIAATFVFLSVATKSSFLGVLIYNENQQYSIYCT